MDKKTKNLIAVGLCILLVMLIIAFVFPGGFGGFVAPKYTFTVRVHRDFWTPWVVKIEDVDINPGVFSMLYSWPWEGDYKVVACWQNTRGYNRYCSEQWVKLSPGGTADTKLMMLALDGAGDYKWSVVVYDKNGGVKDEKSGYYQVV